MATHVENRSSRLEVFCRKEVFSKFLRSFAKFTGEHLYQILFFNKVAGLRSVTLLKKETLALVFSCKFCEISEETYFYITTSVAVSGRTSVVNGQF